MAEEAVEEEEKEEEECPKCPPVGAPAWMATFADMATLLMAFFVLILSFAEFNVPKFKQISGSLKNAFGIQRTVPVVEPPKGTTILSLNFSPNPTPSVQENLKQQTTETDQPKVEQQTNKDTASKDDAKNEDAEELAKRLPSSTSNDYGKPFADIFKEYKYDFYKIDKMLFSPAKVIVSSLQTGKSYTSGDINLSLMDDSFNK